MTGDSYGGGQSLMLAALRDRMMIPDGRLVPWRSPVGRRLQVAAAAPVIPWSDLVSAAAPNGRVKANGITSRREAQTPVGVEKASFVNAIAAAAQFATGPGQPVGEPFVPGRPMGYLAPAGTDPQADVLSWVARTNAGEPYADPAAQAIVRLLTRYHSPYYLDAEPRAGAPVHRLRIHRRPVPGRRGTAVREPDPKPLPSNPAVAAVRRLRAPEGREQARRALRALGSHPWLVRSLSARQGLTAAGGHRLR